MPMIAVDNVSKWYGQFQVLTDCTTKVEKGEVIVVCGPSGSGKSTLIKCVNALEPFQKGQITVDGVPVHDPKTNLPKLRARVGMVFQHFELFPHLSITDFLGAASKVAQRDGRLVEMYIFAAIVYFIVSFGLSLLVKQLQKKIAIIR